MESIIVVKGMSCEHCVRAVSEIVSRVTGAREVRVDLDNGNVTLVEAGDYSPADLARELEDAGYELG